MTLHRRAHRVRKMALALAAAWLTGSATAQAQYVGPSVIPTHNTIADVLKNPVDDAMVTLTGFIIKKVGSDKYLFSDGTSQIRVEIDHKHFPPTPVTEKTKVRIRGEIEKEFLETLEIDVDHLEILSAS